MAGNVSTPKKKGGLQPEKYITSMELILLRNYYYQDSYHRLMKIFLILLVIMGLMIFSGIYEKNHIPPPIYFATDYDSKPLQLLPLSQPNVKPISLLEWSVEAATTAYTFNFVNYRKALQDTRAFFTLEGYQKFLKALQDSQNLVAVKNRKLVVSATPKGNAIILRDSQSDPNFRINGAYCWQVQIPMVLTYQSAREDKFLQNIVLTMIVTRVSTLESPRGLGIDSYVVSEIT